MKTTRVKQLTLAAVMALGLATASLQPSATLAAPQSPPDQTTGTTSGGKPGPIRGGDVNDLVIAGASIAPRACAGRAVAGTVLYDVRVRVENRGAGMASTPAGVVVRVEDRDGMRFLATANLGALVAGADQELTIPVAYPADPTYAGWAPRTLEITVDSTNLAAEVSEDNNARAIDTPALSSGCGLKQTPS